MTEIRWRKSSYSGLNNGDCVEVSDSVPGLVPIRDSKRADDGPVVTASVAAFSCFVGALRSGELSR